MRSHRNCGLANGTPVKIHTFGTLSRRALALLTTPRGSREPHGHGLSRHSLTAFLAPQTRSSTRSCLPSRDCFFSLQKGDVLPRWKTLRAECLFFFKLSLILLLSHLNLTRLLILTFSSHVGSRPRISRFRLEQY